jgi:hypothetical protein
VHASDVAAVPIGSRKARRAFEETDVVAHSFSDRNDAAATLNRLNLAGLFAGYTKSPTYAAGASSCLTTSIKSTTLTVTPKSACGIVYLPVTVTDGDKDTMTRQLAIYAGP